MKIFDYTVIFEPIEAGGYMVVVPALPGIVTYGESLENAREMAKDAIKCHIEGLIEEFPWLSNRDKVYRRCRRRRNPLPHRKDGKLYLFDADLVGEWFSRLPGKDLEITLDD